MFTVNAVLQKGEIKYQEKEKEKVTPRVIKNKYSGFQFTIEASFKNLSGSKKYSVNSGFAGTIGYRFNSYLSLGVGVEYFIYDSFNDFDSYQYDPAKCNAVPVFAALRVNMFHLKFLSNIVLSPYAEIAGGACFDNYTVYDNYVVNTTQYRESRRLSKTYFYYNGAMGLNFHLSKMLAMNLGVRYNNITNTFALNAGVAVTFVK
jgi:hypothetical protein